MIGFSCNKCGNTSLEKKNGLYVCPYCGSTFFPDEKIEKAIHFSKQNSISSTVSLQSDIDMLLEKCRKDPRNAKRYANRILDIDPTNKEAQKYI